MEIDFYAPIKIINGNRMNTKVSVIFL
jgi:hypothetical protein